MERIEITHLHPRGLVEVAADGSGDSWAADIWRLAIPYRTQFHFSPNDVFSCYLEGDPLTRPAAPTLTTATTGGSLVPGTYNVQVTAVSSMGQTDAAPVTPIVVPAGTATNTITVTWGAVIGAVSYNIFLSTHALPLFHSSHPSSPRTIGTAGTGAAAPTVNTAWDEMPGTTKVRILHRSLMGQVLYEILNERNYVLAQPFVGKGKLLHLECYPMTVFSPDLVVVQVRGLAVSGGDVNPVRSRFRLSAHWERERI